MRFSIVVPVYKPDPSLLLETIISVQHQTFADWELILVDDASVDAHVSKVLQSTAGSDPRIRVLVRPQNGHIVAATNEGMDAATGEWIAFLDHDDLLTPDALEALDAAIESQPSAMVVYSDEDKIASDGTYYDAFRKPDWSPELLRHTNYLNHLTVIRADHVRSIGKLRSGYDGSQDHDLVLRATENGEHVVHVPRILYHWRASAGSAAADPTAKPYATDAGRRAVSEHLDRIGMTKWNVEPASDPHSYVTRRSFDSDTHFISVVIPTRGTRGMVWGLRRSYAVECVRSIVSRTETENYEIVLVYDLDFPERDLQQIIEIAGAHLTLVPYDAPFNFSDKCNRGFLRSVGDLVVFMNDDMEVISESFLEKLVAPLAEKSVGATGARLLFSDRSIQNAGIAVLKDQLFHPYAGKHYSHHGYFGLLQHDREVSALTGACIASRRETIVEAGGWPLDFANNFNDVDLCFRLRWLGYRLVTLSDVFAYHFESVSRDSHVTPAEHHAIKNRIGWTEREPYTPYEARTTLGMNPDVQFPDSPDYRVTDPLFG